MSGSGGSDGSGERDQARQRTLILPPLALHWRCWRPSTKQRILRCPRHHHHHHGCSDILVTIFSRKIGYTNPVVATSLPAIYIYIVYLHVCFTSFTLTRCLKSEIYSNLKEKASKMSTLVCQTCFYHPYISSPGNTNRAPTHYELWFFSSYYLSPWAPTES